MHRLAWVSFLMLAACAPDTPNDAALCRAHDAGQSQVEVTADGVVANVLGTQAGTGNPHEGFFLRLRSGCKLLVRVEVNEAFTGVIPLKPGDSVTVRGEYEYDALGGVIHWTHHDPRGRHLGGYVLTGGSRYE